MANGKIEELESRYDLELGKIVSEIKKNRAKLVLLQFPDGLKPYATKVVDFLEEHTKKTQTEFLIWLGSCYGACDTLSVGNKIKPKIDLIFQFGHNELQPPY